MAATAASAAHAPAVHRPPVKSGTSYSALLGRGYCCRQQQMRLIFCRAGVQLQAGLLPQHRQPGTDVVMRHLVTRRTAAVGAGINNAQTPAATLRLQLNTDITAFNPGLDAGVKIGRAAGREREQCPSAVVNFREEAPE